MENMFATLPSKNENRSPTDEEPRFYNCNESWLLLSSPKRYRRL